jgi:hypothetical protein
MLAGYAHSWKLIGNLQLYANRDDDRPILYGPFKVEPLGKAWLLDNSTDHRPQERFQYLARSTDHTHVGLHLVASEITRSTLETIFLRIFTHPLDTVDYFSHDRQINMDLVR